MMLKISMGIAKPLRHPSAVAMPKRRQRIDVPSARSLVPASTFHNYSCLRMQTARLEVVRRLAVEEKPVLVVLLYGL
jgi:hypothetical protein